MLNGGNGNDTITGQLQDIISGGSGNDVITMSGIDGFATPGSIDAGDGDDTLFITRDGFDGGYSILAGAGNDLVHIVAMSDDVTLSLGAGRDTVEMGANGLPLKRQRAAPHRFPDRQQRRPFRYGRDAGPCLELEQ